MAEVKLELPTSVLLVPTSPPVDDASATRLRRAAVGLLVLSLLTFHGIAGPAGVVASVGVLLASSNGLVKSARCIRVTATITAVAASLSATFLAYAFVTDMPTRHVAAIEGQCNTIPSATFEWGELVWQQHHQHHGSGWRPSDARPDPITTPALEMARPSPALAHHYHHLDHHDRSEGRSLQEVPVETDTKVAAGSDKTVKAPDPPKTVSAAAMAKEHADKDVEDDEDDEDDADDEDDEEDADDDSEEAILAAAEVAVDAAEAEGLYDSTDQVSTDDDVLNEDDAILQAAETAVEAFEAEMEELETFYLYGGDSDGKASQGAHQEEPADKRAQYCHMAALGLARWGSAALAAGALSQLLLALSAAVVAKRAALLR